MTAAILKIVLVLLGIYAYAVLYLFVAALIARSRQQKRKQAAEMVRPEIARALVEYVAGNEDLTAIRAFAETHREELEDGLLQYQAALSGGGRDRLADLAIELSLVQRWCQETRSRSVARRRTALSRLAMVAAHEPSRRVASDTLLEALDDSDREARLEAARTLIHSGDTEVIVEIFRLATTQPMIVRAVLADDLRRYALDLCQAAVPAALESGDNRRVQAALEILAAWERALPLTGMAALARHRDPAIRVLALKVLPLVPASRDGADAVLEGLGDTEDEVAAAAAAAAARLKLDAAMVPLARCLRLGKINLARSAAAALAGMPPRGWETLEELSRSANAITASAALEALERARKSTLGT